VNVSRSEQRVLRVLAQGGRILHFKDERGQLVEVACVSREGFHLSCPLDLFKQLRRRRLVASTNGGPYLISKVGLLALRSVHARG